MSESTIVAATLASDFLNQFKMQHKNHCSVNDSIIYPTLHYHVSDPSGEAMIRDPLLNTNEFTHYTLSSLNQCKEKEKTTQTSLNDLFKQAVPRKNQSLKSQKMSDLCRKMYRLMMILYNCLEQSEQNYLSVIESIYREAIQRNLPNDFIESLRLLYQQLYTRYTEQSEENRQKIILMEKLLTEQSNVGMLRDFYQLSEQDLQKFS